ncbi:ATP-binding protein [Prosthecobacter sp.]|uniref:ATP-binding protein n=1 Tax=Prosthecobacter sp. TaxID=1965333 RepID=UPI003782EEF8
MNTPAASPPERSEQDVITALQATVSASRLSLFLQCRLKFYFRYVLKLNKPKIASLHLGNAVHAVLKAWNKARWVQQPLSLKVVHEQIERIELLVLDELGYVPFSNAGAELLFDVISRAYERTCVIITTNLPFENWTEVLGSERLTGAMLDRLTHRVHILEANGESYRLKDAKARLKRR